MLYSLLFKAEGKGFFPPHTHTHSPTPTRCRVCMFGEYLQVKKESQL